MNQQRRIVAVLAGLLAVSLVPIAVTSLVPEPIDAGLEKSADCDKQYNRTMAGNMNASRITEGCRPLPESVKKRVLARALSG
jgi:hypothetical protein